VTAAGRPRRTVISLATGDKRFSAGLERLGAGLERVGFDGAFEPWQEGRYPSGCPPHLLVPFAFKPYCFAEARDGGAELVLWLDSTCLPVQSLDVLFDELERDGYLLFRNPTFILGEWASDLALERLGVARDDAMRMPEVNAAALGLDLRSEIGNVFLDRWLEEARAGIAFRGVHEPLRGRNDYEAVKSNRRRRVSIDRRVRGHRHDQTVAGVLAAQLGLRLRPAGLQPVHHVRDALPETIVVNVRRRRLRRRLRFAVRRLARRRRAPSSRTYPGPR
jgi:hypothetical protein